MPAYEVGGPGSSPGGGTQARLVQRQSACPTNRESGFESSAGYGGCGVVAASEAVNFRGRDRNPAITPGSVAQRRPHSAVNRASPRAGSSPARPTRALVVQRTARRVPDPQAAGSTP